MESSLHQLATALYAGIAGDAHLKLSRLPIVQRDKAHVLGSMRDGRRTSLAAKALTHLFPSGTTLVKLTNAVR